MAYKPLVARQYAVTYQAPSSAPGQVVTITRDVTAAYWKIDGDGFTDRTGATNDFITFDDTDHKPVYTIRRGSVLSIEQTDADPYNAPPVDPSDIINADAYRTAEGTAWDEGKILRGVLSGRLSIDSARFLLGKKPFNLPNTRRGFTYDTCPLGCDGETQHCSDCPE